MNLSALLLFCGTALGVALGLRADEPRWTYTPATGDSPASIMDGGWTLHVSVMDEAAHTLALGTNNCGSVILDKGANATSTIDLRGGVADTAGTAWTIARIYGTAFSGRIGIPFVTIYTPGTLGEYGFAGQVFKASTVAKLVIEEPDVTGLFINNTFMNAHPKEFLLKAPKLSVIGGSVGGFPGDFIQNTDVSDWDLSGIRHFVDGGVTSWEPEQMPTASSASGNNGSYMFRNKQFRGVLRLPSIVDPPACSFSNSLNMVGLELGTSNLMTKVGADLVTNCSALVRVVLGGTTGWTLGARAFQAPNLTNVVFRSVAPTFDAVGELAFGTAETAVCTMLFEIPRHDASWTEVISAVRTATATERAAFAARFGEARLSDLIGIVWPNTFKTANCQYLAWNSDTSRTYTISLTLDENHPEQAVVVTPQKDSYAAGETVTIAPAAGQEVFYWWGNVPKEQRRAASLSFTIDQNIRLRPLFRNRWTVTVAENAEAGSAATISDGVWTLNATVLDPSARTLSLGNGTEGGAYADGNAGTGCLNLLGTFTETSGAAWTVTSLATTDTHRTFKCASTDAHGPTAFIAPENVVWRGVPLRACTTLTTFALVSTNAVGILKNNSFYEIPKLETVLLAAPGLDGVGQYAAGFDYSNAFLRQSDVSEWDMSGVQGIGVNEPLSATSAEGGGAFFNKKAFSGVLSLPSLMRLRELTLANTTRMTGLKVGANGALTRIEACAVSNSAALVSVEIGGVKGLQIDGGAFCSPKLASVKFLSTPPTFGAADGELVFGTEETEALSMNFNVKARRRGAWAGVVALARAATDAERARYRFRFGDDTYLVGVVPASVFHTAQEQFLSVGAPDDPLRGMVFILR